ncbi:hypothetical protein EDB92DRAFT_605776 [Lactarius akahatsu]|uniref:DUF6535 domain-containing protein n=1 Tax=Lactarius akahatsu TaxID=416441 RepID=A0AAD4Q4Z3_9AGAM|nr:hypothetical protein EDB92DRAFT_605776 [Lactarius akahatsu]
MGSSIQSPFVPSASAVFINAVWFLSLALNLICALMAILLQQWARRYLEIFRRKYAPLPYARIHEYFSRGARRFGISGFVDVLPVILLLSVSLFFAGLAVFAFRGNQIVAYCTFAIVGSWAFLYIALSLLPLVSRDCPYQTPLTPAFRFFIQMILLSVFSPLYHAKKQLHKYSNKVGEDLVKLLDQQRNKAKSFLEKIISKLENSVESLSIDLWRNLSPVCMNPKPFPHTTVTTYSATSAPSSQTYPD